MFLTITIWEENLLVRILGKEEEGALRKLPCHLLACWDMAYLLTFPEGGRLAIDLNPCRRTQPGLWCPGIAI